jgi:hypothetical protein
MTPDLRGIEHDWIAVDQDGHLGFFSTAGAGFYPVFFADNLDVFVEAIEDLLQLPESSQVLFAPNLSTWLTNDWRSFAARGFYAYDCDPCGGPYRKVAAPKSPVHVSDISSSMQLLAGKIRFDSICFSNRNVINESDAEGIKIVNS